MQRLLTLSSRFHLRDVSDGINGYYCWISTTYGDERVTLDLLWVRRASWIAVLLTYRASKLFLGAGLGFLLYGLVFLNLRGNVTTSGIYFRRDSRIVRMIDEDSVAIARQMLIYPVGDSCSGATLLS